jgi:D-serine deaminase-like pyridoxal phosphate-dependent protein
VARTEGGSFVGKQTQALDTPALLVDLDVMDANIARACREHGVGWRPHMKGHKTVEIARRQLAAGAIGITCAKLGEAEVMAEAGIDDILIANQIVGAEKVRRLVALSDRAKVAVAVDSVANLAELAEAARGAARPLPVAIEVDTGMKRPGVAPGAPVVAMADAIAQHPSLRFKGLVG